jgi:hypothetical protein
MFMPRCKRAGQQHNVKIGNRFFEDVAGFKYLATTQTDENSVHVELKRRLNLGKACYRSVQSLLSNCLLCRNLEVKISKTTVFPFVLNGCEA